MAFFVAAGRLVAGRVAAGRRAAGAAAGRAADIAVAPPVNALAAVDMALVAVFIACMALDMVLERPAIGVHLSRLVVGRVSQR